MFQCGLVGKRVGGGDELQKKKKSDYIIYLSENSSIIGSVVKMARRDPFCETYLKPLKAQTTLVNTSSGFSKPKQRNDAFTIRFVVYFHVRTI